MRDLKIHFTGQQQPDYFIKPGVHRIARHANGNVTLVEDTVAALLLAQFCRDRRGLWLQVANGIRGIHVNGRPVLRMAMLRAGDAVYADGVEMLVQGELGRQSRIPAPGSATDASAADPCLLLRGLGGAHHGRSFTLDRARVVGSDPGADIVIADPTFAARHARLERHGEAVLLRDLGSEEGSLVNGVAVRDCWLQVGDQVVFDTRHRFVLEMPLQQASALISADPDAAGDESVAVDAQPGSASPARVRFARWPWLLLSALLLAALLSALLWFGAR